MAIVNDYQTGTVSVSSGTTAVTGVGTAWQTAEVRPGDMFMRGGYGVAITAVIDNTHLTLAESWPGASLANSAYRIRFQPDGARYTAAARALVERLADGKLDSLAQLTGTADKLPYLSGSTTFALTDFKDWSRQLLALTPAQRKGFRLGATSVPELFDLSDFALSILDDTNGSAVLTTLGIKGVRQIKKVNSTATPVSTSSTDFVQVEAISLTAATPVSSPTSSLLVLCNLQVESSRGGTAGQTGVSANLFRYTGSTYTSVGDPTVQSLDTASTEAVSRIVRGQLQLMSLLPASARRTDLPTTWTVAPYFANIYSGATARIINFSALMIEIEP